VPSGRREIALPGRVTGRKRQHEPRSGTERGGFSAQDGSEDAEDSCRRARDVPGFWSRAEDDGYFWRSTR